ncbi:MAG TPA: hypothetical protein PKM91_12245 [Cyclobacteriaceae bacterium]|nr:hypothetical protein [Cyclobacteriaceae bacterium]
MKLLWVELLLLLVSCAEQKRGYIGHWHEELRGKLVHCYHVSDAALSLDQWTVGWTMQGNGVGLYSQVLHESRKDYTIGQDEIRFNDSIVWRRAGVDDFECDFSIGLMVTISLQDMQQDQRIFSYDSLAGPRIFVGQRNDQRDRYEVVDTYCVELDGELKSPNDIPLWLNPHDQARHRPVVIYMDRITPFKTIQEVRLAVLRAGYAPSEIYYAVADRRNKMVHLIQDGH